MDPLKFFMRVAFSISLSLFIIVLLTKCTKPKPVAEVIDPSYEIEQPKQAEPTKSPTSYGHQFAETPPKVRTGPSVMFSLDDARVRRDIDTDYLIGAKRITLTGHACPLGNEAYNMALSLRRAESVKANLVKSGINPDHITTEGKGESEPLPGDYSLSRRVDVTFTLR
jgi:OOP family OmpA-OmpF porin